MKDFTKTDGAQTKKELSKPMRDLIRLLAKIAVDEYIEEEKQKDPSQAKPH